MSAGITEGPGQSRAPLAVFLSASGGTGKSSIALMAAYLAARAGLRTALVEADLQFGDMGFWLGKDAEPSTLAQGRQTQPVQLAPTLDLYKAPCFPELAEAIADDVALLVEDVRHGYDLVFADTGAFWTGLTAALAVEASLCVNVLDQRPSSVAGAVRAKELCSRIGVPHARCVFVCNRCGGRGPAAFPDAVHALGADQLLSVRDGKQMVDDMLCAGDLAELVEQENPFARSVDAMLGQLLARVGLVYEPRFGTRSRRWL